MSDKDQDARISPILHNIEIVFNRPSLAGKEIEFVAGAGGASLLAVS